MSFLPRAILAASAPGLASLAFGRPRDENERARCDVASFLVGGGLGLGLGWAAGSGKLDGLPSTLVGARSTTPSAPPAPPTAPLLALGPHARETLRAQLGALRIENRVEFDARELKAGFAKTLRLAGEQRGARTDAAGYERLAVCCFYMPAQRMTARLQNVP